MSKELTERFESDCLDCGFYYASIPDEGVIILRSSDRHYLETSDGDKIDILSAVPSYEEWKRLQEQIKDAEYILDEMGWADRGLIDDYFEKWGVK